MMKIEFTCGHYNKVEAMNDLKGLTNFNHESLSTEIVKYIEDSLLSNMNNKVETLFISSNSDTVMNACRLFAKKHNQEISLNFKFYDKTGHIEHIQCYDDGQLSSWPEGFFDYWDKVIFELLK